MQLLLYTLIQIMAYNNVLLSETLKIFGIYKMVSSTSVLEQYCSLNVPYITAQLTQPLLG